MNSSIFKKALPHIIAIAVFLIVSVIYCKPALDGKTLNQIDVIGHAGMARQSLDFYAAHGYYPLWTESAFSGMPTYTIYLPSSATILNKLAFFLYSFNPITLFFFACVTFYVLTLVLRLQTWLGVLSSIAFAYSTFDPIILAVGHNTQMAAIGFMPLVISGFLWIVQKKYVAGSAMLCISLGLQAGVTQHLQIIYYTGIILGFITIAYFVKCWREKRIKDALIMLGIAACASAVGFATNAVAFLPIQEYAKETMRGGKSELTQTNSGNKTRGGLDKDYAFDWSYGIPETFTLLVPGTYGDGDAGKQFTDNSKFADKLQEIGLPEATALQYANASSYWGTQRNTAGPVYLGAVICFLFIFGLVYCKSWHRWWIIPVSIFAILLAWGKNFSTLNYFLFDYMPFYNKFRAPTMSLVIPQITFPLLAAMGLDQLLQRKEAAAEVWKKFKTSVLITGVLLLLAVLFYFSADFKGPKDNGLRDSFTMGMLQQMARGKQPTPEMQQQVSQIVGPLMKDLQDDRQSLFGSDLLRSFLLIAVSVVLLGAFLKNKIKPVILLAGLTLLSSYDLLAVGRKYLNDDSFIDPADIDSMFRLSEADEKIKSDPEKNFRVFDQTGEWYQDSHASYYHNSIGGYSPAKLGLYEDIIENQLSKYNPMVFDMLNVKYFIRRGASGNDEAVLNPGAFGPCWLVKGILFVQTADEEMKALDSVNVHDTAIVRNNFRASIPFMPVADTAASIRLVENLNDQITYRFSSKTNQFAVFSEVYYDKGWNAYLDGNKTPYCKVDYILRGMAVPAGNHSIEFRFEPKTFATGTRISLIASIIGYILLLAAIAVEWKNRGKKSAAT